MTNNSKIRVVISIPEDVLKQANQLAKNTNHSLDRLFRNALREYLVRHQSDGITEAMDKTCAELGSSQDTFVSRASARILYRSEW